MDGARFCPYCGTSLESVVNSGASYTQATNTNEEQATYPLYPPQKAEQYEYKKKKSYAKIIAAVIVIIILFLIFLAMANQTVSHYGSPSSGIPTPLTGSIRFRYNSVLGNDIKIYVDGDYMGTFSSDEYHLLNGFSPGSHTIEAKALSGGLLDRKTVDVNAGETTTVELSYW